MTVARAQAVIEGCGFNTWADISASKVETYLASLRAGINGLSAQTSNFDLVCVKQLCKWMVQDQRASESPIQHLKRLNVRTDRRHDRRSLEVDEVRRLLETTTAAPVRFGMTGHARAMLYRVAVETGLRANELRSLKAASFDLVNGTVTVEAGYSKHRRQDVLPLRPDTAAELKLFLADRLPNAQAFHVPEKTANMLKADLAGAGTAYVDSAGHYVDFHALEAHVRKLACGERRSSEGGTDDNEALGYQPHDEQVHPHAKRPGGSGCQSLPSLSVASQEAQKALATGTDGKATGEKLTPQLTPKSTLTVFPACTGPSVNDTVESQKHNSTGDRKSLRDGELGSDPGRLSPDVTGHAALRPRGFEPLTSGLGNRCSILLSYGRGRFTRAV